MIEQWIFIKENIQSMAKYTSSFKNLNYLFSLKRAQVWLLWLTSVILATWEAQDKKKLDWRFGSSSRVSALQELSLEFKPKKKKKKKK
jgi:hypothetical protein